MGYEIAYFIYRLKPLYTLKPLTNYLGSNSAQLKNLKKAILNEYCGYLEAKKDILSCNKTEDKPFPKGM